MVRLNDAQFDALKLPDALQEAVAMARKIKSHEAKRRQLQYIGRLMRDVDSEEIEKALERIVAGEAEKRRQFKRVERWRDELAEGNIERLEWLMERYPAINPEELTGLIESARGKGSGMETKKARRVLFRYLNRLIPS
ncbi:MAG: ribosome biogenesis factor YjgA [Desulfobacteraceae bacterium]